MTRPGWFLLLLTVQVAAAGWLVWGSASEEATGALATLTAVWRGMEPFIVVSAVITLMAVEGTAMLAEAFLRERYKKGRVDERKEWQEWTDRRDEAMAKGLPFDEPRPDQRNNGASNGKEHER